MLKLTSKNITGFEIPYNGFWSFNGQKARVYGYGAVSLAGNIDSVLEQFRHLPGLEVLVGRIRAACVRRPTGGKNQS